MVDISRTDPHPPPPSSNTQIGNGALTETEDRSHFSMWCIMASPLIIGCDMRTASNTTLAILGNKVTHVVWAPCA